MPFVWTWKVPAAAFVLGLVAKTVLSNLVDDALGRWVGEVLGFLAVVTLVMWFSQREARSRP
jgi:riboflavin transporter FmnP